VGEGSQFDLELYAPKAHLVGGLRERLDRWKDSTVAALVSGFVVLGSGAQ
jgi:hypothetical protein